MYSTETTIGEHGQVCVKAEEGTAAAITYCMVKWEMERADAIAQTNIKGDVKWRNYTIVAGKSGFYSAVRVAQAFEKKWLKRNRRFVDVKLDPERDCSWEFQSFLGIGNRSVWVTMENKGC